MRILVPLTVAVLSLPLMAATCDRADAFAKACAGLTGAYAVYAEVRSEAGANTNMLVDVSFKNVEPFCRNPPANTTEAAVRVAAASLTIWKAYRSIQRS